MKEEKGGSVAGFDGRLQFHYLVGDILRELYNHHITKQHDLFMSSYQILYAITQGFFSEKEIITINEQIEQIETTEQDLQTLTIISKQHHTYTAHKQKNLRKQLAKKRIEALTTLMTTMKLHNLILPYGEAEDTELRISNFLEEAGL